MFSVLEPKIADMVLEKFHIKMSRTSVGRLLKNGIQWLKCGSLPAKADIGKQNSYFESKKRSRSSLNQYFMNQLK